MSITTDPSIECVACQLLVSALQSENASIVAADIARSLEDLCDDAFNQTHPELLKYCDTVAEAFAAQIPQFARTLNATMYDAQALCRIAGVCFADCCLSRSEPEQFRLALTGSNGEMALSFVALPLYAQPEVRYGCNGTLPTKVAALAHTYTQGGWRGYIFDALMTGLTPGAMCWYVAGDATSNVWSQRISFRALDLDARSWKNPARPLRFLSIGDMGATGSKATLDSMFDLMKVAGFDVVMHNGDISYADAIESLWDEFLRNMAPISSAVPYMTTPGNHELPWDFASYKARFGKLMGHSHARHSIHSVSPDMWWSVSIGSVHLVGINTEDEADMPLVSPEQLAWLSADLQRANSPQERSLRPFIVIMGHRPLYCSGSGGFVGKDCGVLAQYLQDKLEDIFVANQVSLVFQAHKHQYERSKPVINGRVQNNGSYIGTKAPVYIVNGAAGSREGMSHFEKEQPEWSAVRIRHFGFGILSATPSELRWDFYNDTSVAIRAVAQPGTVFNAELADSFVLTRPS